MSAMTRTRFHSNRGVIAIEDPPIARALFSDTRWAWIWVPFRLYAGYEWMYAGYEKVINPAWTGQQAGAALTGFIKGALSKTAGDHPDVQSWYASFLQAAVLPNASWWSHLVAYGELLVGIALIVGALTGIAAFFGCFMNMNYLLAGTVSTNPILLAIGLVLVLAWKTAGWYGVDRWLLPALGTPWRPGYIFREMGEGGGTRTAPAPGE